LVIAPIHPWSAAGAEKPIFIFAPVGALAAAVATADAAADAAAVAAGAAAELVALDVLLLVHPAMSALAATMIPSVVTSFVLRALMDSLFLVVPVTPEGRQDSCPFRLVKSLPGCGRRFVAAAALRRR
jgi:hypothetical protein